MPQTSHFKNIVLLTVCLILLQFTDDIQSKAKKVAINKKKGGVLMNFKVKIVETTGLSIIGKVGDVLEVRDGVLFDEQGFRFDSVRKIENIEILNEEAYPKVRFQLLEENVGEDSIFSLSDIESGDVVELRSGLLFIAIINESLGGYIYNSKEKLHLSLESYDSNMYMVEESGLFPNEKEDLFYFDIVKVYRPRCISSLKHVRSECIGEELLFDVKYEEKEEVELN